MSAGVNIPDSDTIKRPPGTRGASLSVVSSDVSNVASERLLIPISLASSISARSISASSWHSTSTSMPNAAAPSARSSASSSSTAAMMIKIASAPTARLSAICQGSIMKSLRNTGSAHRRARGDQKILMALKTRRVRQHRETRRAALGISARQRGWIEIGADHAARRARLLDLRDQRRPASTARQRVVEPARRRLRLRLRLNGAPRPQPFSRRYFLAFVGNDIGQHAHGAPRLMATSFCSARSAAALSQRVGRLLCALGERLHRASRHQRCRRVELHHFRDRANRRRRLRAARATSSRSPPPRRP